ncbi:DUF2163 domain-containing protein [Litorimonas sp. WD9-15]|uniref:DUF2163 domain-containing protein n=1 Tax=Litorimonas sp. WD9-15 TaxID=3418716 RepID=UPI003D022B3E
MSEVTTLCFLWRLTLKDGSTIGLTDHDVDLNIDGVTYSPRSGAESSLIETQAGLAADSATLQTVLDLPNLSPQAIRDGALDTARIAQFRHDWRRGETVLLSEGRIGDISQNGDRFEAEWLGLASLLDRSTGRVFSRQCDASFGDTRCGLNITDFPEDTDCPRTFLACRDQFANTLNFRGFPYLLGDDALQSDIRSADRRDGSSRYRL